jgi:NAD(P)H-hydrate epimerase
MKLVTVAQMRELEQAAVAAGVSEAQLMAEAGLAVAQEAWLLLGNLEGQPIAVLAGPGSNGGDAIVAARHLAEWGATIAVIVPSPRGADPLLEELRQFEVQIAEGEFEEVALEQVLAGSAVVIDGLLGIGRSRAIEPDSWAGSTLRALAGARRRPGGPKVIAVDVPSGMDADSGAIDPLMVEPDITVTFALPKVGMYQSPASAHLGRVQVVNIGIPAEAVDGVSLELLTARWARTALPDRPENSNKGTFGKVVVIGGSRQYIGAPRLVGAGAYRSGAGLVTIAAPNEVVDALAGALVESTWLPLNGGEDGGLGGHAAAAIRQGAAGYDAAVFGPGMGHTEASRTLTWAVLPDLGEICERGVVVDADGLNALAALDDGPERVPANAILTPHPGEMARLLGRSVDEVQADRISAARDAAGRFACTVVLKGAHTVVAEPGGRTRLCPYANPLLATAGSGGVLSGVIAGYLAQGLAPFEAACLGVYMHAATGEALRGELGEAGLLASEIADRLPRIVREVAAS